jgi:hypothetical protein
MSLKNFQLTSWISHKLIITRPNLMNYNRTSQTRLQTEIQARLQVIRFDFIKIKYLDTNISFNKLFTLSP